MYKVCFVHTMQSVRGVRVAKFWPQPWARGALKKRGKYVLSQPWARGALEERGKYVLSQPWARGALEKRENMFCQVVVLSPGGMCSA